MIYKSGKKVWIFRTVTFSGVAENLLRRGRSMNFPKIGCGQVGVAAVAEEMGLRSGFSKLCTDNFIKGINIDNVFMIIKMYIK